VQAAKTAKAARTVLGRPARPGDWEDFGEPSPREPA